MNSVFYEDDDLLIVIKPRGLPTAPLAKKNDFDNLCQRVFTQWPGIAQIQGFNPQEGGLLHRLDNDTAGLVLFCKNQISFDSLCEQADRQQFKKGYRAYCQPSEAVLSPEEFSLEQWQSMLNSIEIPNEKLFNFTCRFVKAKAKSAQVRAVHANSTSLKATLPYSMQFSLSACTNYIEAKSWLHKGFRHQVRASLSALGLPITGDPVYNPSSQKPFAFWATDLSFIHPVNHRPTYFHWEVNED